VHPDPAADTRTRNIKKLAAAVSHGGTGFSEIVSVFKAFTELLPFELSISETKHPSFIPGRCAVISLGSKNIGILGEIHPRVLSGFGLKMPVAAFEIDSESLWNEVVSK
jgi:phenylalanyl-tRNA synthetase beta chain